MKRSIILLLALAPLVAAGLGASRTASAQSAASSKQAVVETSAGAFVIDLAAESAPNQAAYFMKLAGDGTYNGTVFHRVIRYGMVQGGDPLSKDPSKRAQ